MLPCQTCICPSRLAQELTVSAGLHHAAAIQHHDLVCALDRGEPMSNQHHSAPSHPLRQGLLQAPLAFHVQGAGRLVQYEDLGPLEQGAGDGHPLLLTTRQPPSEAADRSVQAQRKGGGELRHAGHARHLLDFGVARPGAAVADVLADGALEEPGLLLHVRDLLAQPAGRHAAQVPPSELYRAGARVVGALQQPADRGLAAAAAADQRRRAAGWDDRREAGQRLLAWASGVLEEDVSQCQTRMSCIAVQCEARVARNCRHRLQRTHHGLYSPKAPSQLLGQADEMARSPHDVEGLLEHGAHLRTSHRALLDKPGAHE
mmetsp:Transcript_48951/g.141824  ORF Transcript_48951/g.141824 Transcript_48951/m.141824 type:complete len:317 (-) Transcript_48951:1247-2197(-)